MEQIKLGIIGIGNIHRVIVFASVHTVTGGSVAFPIGKFGAVGLGEAAVIKLHLFDAIFLSAVYPEIHCTGYAVKMDEDSRAVP